MNPYYNRIIIKLEKVLYYCLKYHNDYKITIKECRKLPRNQKVDIIYTCNSVAELRHYYTTYAENANEIFEEIVHYYNGSCSLRFNTTKIVEEDADMTYELYRFKPFIKEFISKNYDFKNFVYAKMVGHPVWLG